MNIIQRFFEKLVGGKVEEPLTDYERLTRAVVRTGNLDWQGLPIDRHAGAPITPSPALKKHREMVDAFLERVGLKVERRSPAFRNCFRTSSTAIASLTETRGDVVREVTNSSQKAKRDIIGQVKAHRSKSKGATRRRPLQNRCLALPCLALWWWMRPVLVAGLSLMRVPGDAGRSLWLWTLVRNTVSLIHTPQKSASFSVSMSCWSTFIPFFICLVLVHTGRHDFAVRGVRRMVRTPLRTPRGLCNRPPHDPSGSKAMTPNELRASLAVHRMSAKTVNDSRLEQAVSPVSAKPGLHHPGSSSSVSRRRVSRRMRANTRSLSRSAAIGPVIAQRRSEVE